MLQAEEAKVLRTANEAADMKYDTQVMATDAKMIAE